MGTTNPGYFQAKQSQSHATKWWTAVGHALAINKSLQTTSRNFRSIKSYSLLYVIKSLAANFVLQTIWSVIVACLPIGAIFGALPINYVSKKLGRKRGLYVPVFLKIFGIVLTVTSFHVRFFIPKTCRNIFASSSPCSGAFLWFWGTLQEEVFTWIVTKSCSNVLCLIFRLGENEAEEMF